LPSKATRSSDRVARPLGARAQQSKKIPRLCFLTFDPGTLQATRFAFFEGLRDLGYVDGQSINIDYLSAEGHGERFPSLAAECLRSEADIIAVSTTPAAQAAKNATRTIPIIMIALGDPVGTGLVDSLAQPGGNVTGMSMMVPEIAAKRLGLLKEAVPGVSRVLVLTYLDDPIAPLQLKALKDAAQLGLTLQIQDKYASTAYDPLSRMLLKGDGGVQNSEGGWPKMAIFARGHYPWVILALRVTGIVPLLLSAPNSQWSSRYCVGPQQCR
jgi:ABC-type uncharacterized transport system substrate-binding protein